MKNQKWLILVVSLVLMAGTACALTWLRDNQRLGAPGLKTTPIPGSSIKSDINLPAQVLGFTSSNVPEPELEIGYFPQDTSFAERFYTAPDRFAIQSTVILMGADRTSIHRPEYCMPAQGWAIEGKQVVDLPIQDAPSYPLKVARWNLSKTVQLSNGQTAKLAGLYVYWYVADNEETPDHDKMLEWLTLNLFRTGALQRWAYISYFSVCEPGREDATFERMKVFIAAQVPQFQFPVKQK